MLVGRPKDRGNSSLTAVRHRIPSLETIEEKVDENSEITTISSSSCSSSSSVSPSPPSSKTMLAMADQQQQQRQQRQPPPLPPDDKSLSMINDSTKKPTLSKEVGLHSVSLPSSSSSSSSPVLPKGLDETFNRPSILSQLIWRKKWSHAERILQHPTHGWQEASRETTLPCLGGSIGLPLHLACTMRPLPPVSLIQQLVTVYPKACQCRQKTWGLLPLHLAVDLSLHDQQYHHHQQKQKQQKYKTAGFQIPKQPSQGGQDVDARDESESEHCTALSFRMLASEPISETLNHAQVVHFLIQVDPESIYAREDTNGMLPLHIAASTARSENGIVSPTSSAILSILLEQAPDTRHMVDGYGDTPVVVAWRETRFCCYHCGRKGDAPCLCKSRIAVATQYIHPLLREDIETIATPSTRVLDDKSPRWSNVLKMLTTYQNQNHIGRRHQRRKSGDSTITVKANNYSKEHHSKQMSNSSSPLTLEHVEDFSQDCPTVDSDQLQGVSDSRMVAIASLAINTDHDNNTENDDDDDSIDDHDMDHDDDGDWMGTSSSHSTHQKHISDAMATPPKTGRLFFRSDSPRSRSPPVPWTPTIHNHLLTIQQKQLEHPQYHDSDSVPKTSVATTNVDGETPAPPSMKDMNDSHPSDELSNRRPGTYAQACGIARNVTELRPRLTTPPEILTPKQLPPPDPPTDNDVSFNNEGNKGNQRVRNTKGEENASRRSSFSMGSDDESVEGFACVNSVTFAGKGRTWDLLACKRRDEGDDDEREDQNSGWALSSSYSSQINERYTPNSIDSSQYLPSTPGFTDADTDYEQSNQIMQSASALVNTKMTLPKDVAEPHVISPGTNTTATASSSTSSHLDREMRRCETSSTTVPTSCTTQPQQRFLLRIQLRFTDLRRPMNSKHPKRAPNPYYEVFITNGSSIASRYQSQPLMKAIEGTWEEALIDVTSKPKKSTTTTSTASDKDVRSSPPPELDNWRIGFRVLHCPRTGIPTDDSLDQSNVIGLCRTSLDKLRDEPRQPILHGFQVMGWLDVEYLSIVKSTTESN